MLTESEILDLENRLERVLVDLSAVEGDLDVEAEFQSAIAAESAQADEMYEEIRQMSRRFGPHIIKLLGFPAIPGGFAVRVDREKTVAELDVTPPVSDGPAISADDVRRRLDEMGVVFGIDETAITAAVERGRTEPAKGVVIAKGVPASPGHDGRIELIRTWGAVPAGMTRPAAEAAGGLIADLETVEKDQKIARLVAPTAGTPGKDIFGKEIAAGAGRPLVPDPGPNVSFDALAGFFYAKEPGRVILDEGCIDIEKMMRFASDIDISVGHVLFPGEILVRGWVRTGLSVQARQDIVIEGGVESATVTSQEGSVLVARGIQGSGFGMIQAAGDVRVKFIEHASVCAGGALQTESAVGSTLAAGESVTVTDGRGVVIGGTIYAGERVEVRDLGAGTGEPTLVHLGITPDQLKALSRLKQRMQAILKSLNDAELALAHFGLSSESLRPEALTDDGRQMLKLAKTILVLKTRQRKIEIEETKFMESMKNRSTGTVDVRGRVHPGVRIQIGHALYLVSEPISWVRFKYDPDRRRIKAIPLV
ncbi:MAG: hypothetical protein A3G34_06060 [Candidatus Lindowbacteria bacterium RIFCSPLOWO2_12_FULL_62_27]|nr:MAG: hypothetical protein A3G34_06060 [Candidatus Lindowbacteria bacterium RIFCSPLOWO2_12_FULL_62_27]OGH57462.1 MAG: hypothetical protein A3I06_06430 [Candidatus Lindowbacteria bacterium RIFCSPLOWO2_02_FULL_62_12]